MLVRPERPARDGRELEHRPLVVVVATVHLQLDFTLARRTSGSGRMTPAESGTQVRQPRRRVSPADPKRASARLDKPVDPRRLGAEASATFRGSDGRHWHGHVSNLHPVDRRVAHAHNRATISSITTSDWAIQPR